MKSRFDAIDAAAWGAVASLTVWVLKPVVPFVARHVPAVDELRRIVAAERVGEGAGHPRVPVDRARPYSRRHDKAAPSRARLAA